MNDISALNFAKEIFSSTEKNMNHGPTAPRVGQLIEVINPVISFGDYIEGDRGLITEVRINPGDPSIAPNIVVQWITNKNSDDENDLNLEGRCGLLYPAEYRIINPNNEDSVTYALGD